MTAKNKRIESNAIVAASAAGRAAASHPGVMGRPGLLFRKSWSQ
jgi:hypothetical protein